MKICRMKNFKINKEQTKAFKSVERAVKKVQKAGLIFYGKSGNLVAYTKDASDYADQDFESCFGYGTGRQIDCISEAGLIRDSGGDDYPSFITEADEELCG
jgi:predicted MarR family transcription regulator